VLCHLQVNLFGWLLLVHSTCKAYVETNKHCVSLQCEMCLRCMQWKVDSHSHLTLLVNMLSVFTPTQLPGSPLDNLWALNYHFDFVLHTYLKKNTIIITFSICIYYHHHVLQSFLVITFLSECLYILIIIHQFAHSWYQSIFWFLLIIPAKARDYVFTGVGLSVCLFVTTITK